MKFIIRYKQIFIWLLSGMLMCMFAACGFGGEDEESLLYALDTSEESSQSVPDTSEESSQSFPNTSEESSQSVSDMSEESSQSVLEVDNSKQEILSSESEKEQLLSATECYRSILLDKADFINCSEDGEYQEAVNNGNIEKTFTSSEDITGEVTGFTIVDMDGDGENEIVLSISTGSVDEGFEVLHYQDGIVYGYHFWYRALEDLKEDGTFTGSGGASSSSINRIVFLEKGYAVDTLYESRSQYGTDGVNEIQYYKNGEVCSEEEFNDALNRQYEKASVTWYKLTTENVTLAFENRFSE